MRPTSSGLWVPLPGRVLRAAIAHGKERQKRALERHARPRYAEERAGQFEENHIDQSIVERGVALALGVRDPMRVDTDHDIARLDLPDGVGAWPRACALFRYPAQLKARQDDFGVVISGRIHPSETLWGRTPVTIVEVRAWSRMEVIRTWNLSDPGERGAKAYFLPWASNDVYPIEDLIAQYKLTVPPAPIVLRFAPPGISVMTDFPPPEHVVPPSTGLPKCPFCGLPNHPENTVCYHCLTVLKRTRKKEEV